jgi:sulfur carrier protein
MTIELNGEIVEVTEGLTVGEVITHAGAEPDERGVAVAVDGEVVPRSQWPSATLAQGQAVEVVRAVQGG